MTTSAWLARHRLITLYLLALIPALLLALLQPLLARHDEAAHVDYAAQLAHGVYPRVGTTTIRPETFELMKQTGVFGWNSDFAPLPDYERAAFEPAPADLTGRARGLWVRRNIWQYSYESFEPPLYYVIAATLWKPVDAVAGPLAAVYVLRVFNALLLALLAPLTFATALRLWPAATPLHWLAGAAAGLVPGLTLNATHVTNDTLVAVLCGLCLLVGMTGMQEGWTLRRASLLGVLFGAALEVKVNAAGLVPALGFALLYQPLRQRPYKPLAFLPAVVATTFGLACVLPWLGSNLIRYHTLTPLAAREVFNGALDPWHLSVAYVVVNLVSAYMTFIVGEPYQLTLSAGWPLMQLMAFVAPVPLAGLYWAIRRRRPGLSYTALMFLLLALGGAVALAVALPLISGDDYLTPGRYTWPAVVAGLVLFTVLIDLALPWRTVKRGIAGLLVISGCATMLAYIGGLWLPGPPGPRRPPPGAREVLLAERGSFAGLEIAADRLDLTSDAAWMHVELTNTAEGPIDWEPAARVRSVGDATTVLATGDYRRSTQLPRTIQPDETVSGWICFPVTLRGPLVVRFDDIAAAGYHQIGGLSLPLDIG